MGLFAWWRVMASSRASLFSLGWEQGVMMPGLRPAIHAAHYLQRRVRRDALGGVVRGCRRFFARTLGR